MDKATCAVCGRVKELCDSVRINGIKQPRYCFDCMLLDIHTPGVDVSDEYWIKQMAELHDTESLAALEKGRIMIDENTEGGE